MIISNMDTDSRFTGFTDKLTSRLYDYYGSNYSISINEVTKNNDNHRHSIIIRKEGENITPSIYLEEFFERYEEGDTFSEIVSDIITLRNRHSVMSDFDFERITDYAWAKEYLGIKLVSKQLNSMLLLDTPHWNISDLTIVFYVSVENEELGNGAILIRNAMLKEWNITVERLYMDARENMMRKNPPYVIDIVDMLMDMRDAYSIERIIDTDDMRGKMYVLTNQSKYYGAATLCYPGLLGELADRFNGDFFVIPSSIHEVILVPSTNCEDRNELSMIISDVNKNCLEKEEVLSSHAYLYHRNSNWLEPLD